MRVMDRQEVGKLGEKAAQRFIKKRGYRIRQTGFRCRHGEMKYGAGTIAARQHGRENWLTRDRTQWAALAKPLRVIRILERFCQQWAMANTN